MAAHEYVLTGDPARAKQTSIDALAQRNFRITWSDDWTAVAEKGNKIANALLGAFAQYFKVGVAIRSLDETNSILRIETLSKGYMGGIVGASRTRKNFAQLRDELAAIFAGAGVLVEQRDPDKLGTAPTAGSPDDADSTS